MKRILVVGRGIGGVASSLMLVDEIKQHGLDAEVTLVSKSPYHYMPPLWLDVVTDGLSVSETRAPLKGLRYYGVNVVVDEVIKIDLDDRRVKARNRVLPTTT